MDDKHLRSTDNQPETSNSNGEQIKPNDSHGVDDQINEIKPLSQPGSNDLPEIIDPDDFVSSFGERLEEVLSIDTWRSGEDLALIFERLDFEINQAIEKENEISREVRKVLVPRIASRPNAPKGAGLYRATIEQLEAVQRNVLFNGGVEACDGKRMVHDTLPITIAQIGICLVSYNGEQGSWMHHLYRRDLRLQGVDPLEEALATLEQRDSRSGVDQPSKRDRLSELAQRGIMSYAERAVLLDKSIKPWRMGHGNLAPYELLTGSGSMDLLLASLEVLNRLILEHRQFVFIPSAPAERLLLTIGNALRPLEFAIIDTSEERMQRIVEQGHLRGRYRDAALSFYKEAAPKVVVGVYRTFEEVAPQIFYAHADFAQEAAMIAMADSVLQTNRGFPMLIDIANSVCSSTFGADGFNSIIQAAYAKQGCSLRYLGERETRP
ncbi:MAG: hypothetical protein IBX64_10460 [Actinobacteria bacterium]|nr:hypothetical protein [Actinomycetota bacterium]